MADRTMLLVVEDDTNIRDLLAVSLRFAGFDVATAATGTEALRAVERRPPDMILLDVMLPDRDGFEVLRWLRAGGHTVPVLFLTARDGADDKITGLTIGGDDYVTKPFSLEEVIARVNAVLRRTRGVAEPTEAPLRYADLELRIESHEVRRDDKLIQLSPTEFKLLHYLMRNAGRVVSKAQILDQVWRYDFNGEAGVVESYISYLRRKVDCVEPRLIHTVRGIGYVLRLAAR
ncbi:MAG TPA: response regulator transcription factor [Pseudonocardiaceae bacterium]|jgi:two-component system OmpR family response regulator|nr:response regulator transcription factor [Pseudonocardiaceae bacterium]